MKYELSRPRLFVDCSLCFLPLTYTNGINGMEFHFTSRQALLLAGMLPHATLHRATVLISGETIY
jgi:hypothetical protein